MTPRTVVAAITDRAAVQRFLPYLADSAAAILTACRAAG